MNQHRIEVMLRRARLRLVKGKLNITSDNLVKKKRQIAVLSSVSSDSIYYGNFDIPPVSRETLNSSNLPELPGDTSSLPKTSEKKQLCNPGPTPAPTHSPMAGNPRDDAAEINPIANAPVIEVPDEKEIPNDYQFEIIRLRRRVAELECTIRDKDDRVVKALGILEDELQFWHTGVNEHVWETLGAIMRRIGRLESTLAQLKDVNLRVYPPLEIPEHWKKYILTER